MENKPFARLLDTPLQKYIFDVNTNQLVQISAELYNYLSENELMYDIDNINSNLKVELDFLHSRGYLLSKHPQKMQHNQSEFLKLYLDENLKLLTLQVTQQCNFRCSYCPYTTSKFDNQRNHTIKRMSFDTAKKIIDFFNEHSINQSDINIGFYGGEPLLEFNLIKKIVLYSEEKFLGKNITFAITTNGSLFNSENIKFMCEHNFMVTISLDGPPLIHNRSRKFAMTGKGTFSTIEKNIRKIENECPQLINNISFNIVIDPRYSSKDLHDTYTNNEMFSDKNINSTVIDDFFSVEKVVPDENYVIEENIREFKFYEYELGNYPKNRISRITFFKCKNKIEKNRISLHKKPNLSDKMSHSGPCIPGQRKLFVDVDGKFFPCERVSETSSAMNIGDIWNGFDYDKADMLLNIAQLTENHCKNCFALRHCTICARFCDNNGELSSDLKLSNCKFIRYEIEENFKDYLMLEEMKKHYKSGEITHEIEKNGNISF